MLVVIDMSEDRTESILEYFSSRFDKFGDSPKTLDYGSTEVQEKRFDILLKIGDINDCKILDIGCGLGHLFRYIRSRGIAVDYVGYDINSRFIEDCKEKYPEARFELFNIEEKEPQEEFDYVFSSGIYNYGFNGDLNIVMDVINKFFKASKKGSAHNFISILGDFQNPEVNYFDPAEIAGLIQKTTRNYVVRHDYLPHDFTIYMYK